MLTSNFQFSDGYVVSKSNFYSYGFSPEFLHQIAHFLSIILSQKPQVIIGFILFRVQIHYRSPLEISFDCYNLRVTNCSPGLQGNHDRIFIAENTRDKIMILIMHVMFDLASPCEFKKCYVMDRDIHNDLWILYIVPNSPVV